MFRYTRWTIALVALGATAQADTPTGEGRQDDPVRAALNPVSGGLTADMAAQEAVATAPEIRTAQSEVAAADARKARVISRYSPGLGLTGTYRRTKRIEYNFGTGMPFVPPQNNLSIDGTLSVPFSDYALSLMPALRSADSDKDSARLQVVAQLAQTAVTARLAYYDWLRARAQRALAAASLVSVEARLEDAELGVAAGTLAVADKLAIESLVASTRAGLVSAQSFEEIATRSLGILMGRPNGAFKVGEEVRTEGFPVQSTLGTLQGLIARAREHRPEIAALRASEVALVNAAQAAGIGQYPRLDGVANVTTANPNQQVFPPSNDWNTTWFVGAQLSWQLGGYLSARADKMEARANVDRVASQRGSLERQIDLEVRVAWEEGRRAESTATISNTELRAAEATYEQRVQLFRGGEATSTDVIEAELARFDARLRHISARIALRVARAKLVRAAALEGSIP